MAANTWQQSLFTRGPAEYNCPFSGDPSICADATGKFYAIYLAYYCVQEQGVFCQTSTDNGTSWGAPVPVGSPRDQNADKVISACDYSPGSPYLNNCYAVWMENGVAFSRSTNGGMSFSETIHVPGGQAGWAPSVTVGRNGEVYVAWVRSSPSAMFVCTSLDGGVTWGTARQLPHSTATVLTYHPIVDFRLAQYPIIASDISTGPYQGNVYTCWSSEISSNNTNIFFSRSTDNGVSWSDTIRVNDDHTTRWQWWPWMTVHPRTGEIAIAWFDNRDDPTQQNYKIYASVSNDGGLTWATNFTISDRSLPPTTGWFLGDYSGTTYTNVGFLSSWADTRNDAADVYAAWWNNGDSLAITSPNGGENLAIQQPCSVRWQFRYAPDTLNIELNRSYPSDTWERLATVNRDSGYWIWSPTEPATQNARLRVIGQHLITVGDTSDANFTIGMAPPTRLTAYRIGNDIRLRWRSTGAPYYRIYSAASVDGPFDTLEGTTASTTFLDLDTANEPIKFYIVRASTEP